MASQIEQLVWKFISQDLIASRLKVYPRLAKHFGRHLTSGRKPPYYCHPIV
jgi:hypothetical protein